MSVLFFLKYLFKYLFPTYPYLFPTFFLKFTSDSNSDIFYTFENLWNVKVAAIYRRNTFHAFRENPLRIAAHKGISENRTEANFYEIPPMLFQTCTYAEEWYAANLKADVQRFDSRSTRRTFIAKVWSRESSFTSGSILGTSFFESSFSFATEVLLKLRPSREGP